MMNKSEIEWTDFTWNPVTGCEHGCGYCYARKQARRFCGDVRINKGSSQLQRVPGTNLWVLENPFKNNVGATIPFPAGFETTFHKYRLPMPAQKKKPANIFVVSMGDLFGKQVPDEWITDVFDACAAAPWHNYIFLTKNPERYPEICGACRSFENAWFGTSITSAEDATRFNYLPARFRRFVSIEPLHGRIDAQKFSILFQQVNWVIVGAETGQSRNKTTPRREWIEEIVNACRENGVPVLLKDSKEMIAIWGEDLIQEYPEGLRHTEAVIPHCGECQHHKASERHYDSVKDAVMMNHTCAKLGQRIGGRYVRTSPPWCPFRLKA